MILVFLIRSKGETRQVPCQGSQRWARRAPAAYAQAEESSMFGESDGQVVAREFTPAIRRRHQPDQAAGRRVIPRLEKVWVRQQPVPRRLPVAAAGHPGQRGRIGQQQIAFQQLLCGHVS